MTVGARPSISSKMGLIEKDLDRWGSKIPPPIYLEKGGPLGLQFFKISKSMKSCILMQMGSENHNMTSNVENLRPTLVFENRRRRLKFGMVLRILL